MKKILMGLSLSLAVVAASLLPSAAKAQSNEGAPAIVVSMATAKEQLDDFGYLTKAAGQAQIGGLIQLMAGDFLRPLDTNRTMGAYVTLDQFLPSVVAFMPLKDKDALVEVVSEQLGDPEYDGDYMIFTSPEGDDIYCLPKGEWAYMSNMKESLTGLPKDPSAWTKGLEDYNVAVRVNGQNIPAQMKQFAISAMQEGFDEMLNELEQVDPDQAELQRELNANSFEQMVDLINDMDELVLGMEVDAEDSGIHMDFTFTGIEGSQMAEQIDLLDGAESRFLGFLMDDSAINFNAITKMAQADVTQLTQMIDSVAEQGLNELSADPNMSPMEKEVATDIVNTLIEVGKATLETGTIDLGMAVVLDDETTAVVGGAHVAQAKKVENAVKTIVGLVKDDAPPGVEFNLDAEKKGGINYHEIVIPVPPFEEEIQEIVGDEIVVWLGVAEDALYFSVGKGDRSTLDDAIAESKSAKPKDNQYGSGHVDIGKIVQYAAMISGEPQLDAMAASMQGKDTRMMFSSSTVENGATSRLTIQEGFITAVGEAAAQAMEAFGGGVPF
ncbi:MAG: hypothetical protein VYC80_06355 [Planctomycetota bacterium]|nr:hypothetical protein [Planctomycetota bacterium]MEC7978584.1 hypothetical protein [Planctomycetota bacterium]MEE3032200.1 hypothetical protein [Planctomycetota bacterium]